MSKSVTVKSFFSNSEASNSIKEIQKSKKPDKEQPKQVEVFIRVRPINLKETMLAAQMKIKNKEILIKLGPESRNFDKSFTFSNIFQHSSTQRELFDDLMIPSIKSMFQDKRDCLVFSYGVTNAGKTFTILGTQSRPGILIRSIRFLLGLKKMSISSDSLNSAKKCKF